MSSVVMNGFSFLNDSLFLVAGLCMLQIIAVAGLQSKLGLRKSLWVLSKSILVLLKSVLILLKFIFILLKSIQILLKLFNILSIFYQILIKF